MHFFFKKKESKKKSQMVLKATELTLGSGLLAAPYLCLSAKQPLAMEASTAPLDLSSHPPSLCTSCISA